VGIGPSPPPLDRHGSTVKINGVRAQRDSAENVDAGKAHETEVAIGVEVVVGR